MDGICRTIAARAGQCVAGKAVPVGRFGRVVGGGLGAAAHLTALFSGGLRPVGRIGRIFLSKGGRYINRYIYIRLGNNYPPDLPDVPSHLSSRGPGGGTRFDNVGRMYQNRWEMSEQLKGMKGLSPRVGLSWLDVQALPATADEDSREALEEHTKGQAQALYSEDADGCRGRVVCRLLAVETTLLRYLQGLLTDAIADGRMDAAGRIDRLVASSQKRVIGLIDQHRKEHRRGAEYPTMVMIGHADVVGIKE